MKEYEQKLINEGYTLYDQREIQNGAKTNRFATYVNGDMMIHLNLFAPLAADQFHVIYGPSDKLVPNGETGSYTAVVTPSVAIIERTDGMLCMVVQLADGSYFVVDGGKLTIQGSKEAPITLVAGKNTTNLVVTNGGEAILINVKMVGNASPSYANSNKARGIFNDGGTITAKSVEIANMKGDSIYILHDGIVNLDDVTITNSGRYGINVKGILNILNTMNADHALTICGSGNNAIDIENGGKAVSSFESVSESAALIKFIDNLKKDIHVRAGGSQELTNISTTAE